MSDTVVEFLLWKQGATAAAERLSELARLATNNPDIFETVIIISVGGDEPMRVNHTGSPRLAYTLGLLEMAKDRVKALAVDD